jgi:hypothetical protein
MTSVRLLISHFERPTTMLGLINVTTGVLLVAVQRSLGRTIDIVPPTWIVASVSKEIITSVATPGGVDTAARHVRLPFSVPGKISGTDMLLVESMAMPCSSCVVTVASVDGVTSSGMSASKMVNDSALSAGIVVTFVVTVRDREVASQEESPRTVPGSPKDTFGFLVSMLHHGLSANTMRPPAGMAPVVRNVNVALVASPGGLLMDKFMVRSPASCPITIGDKLACAPSSVTLP